MPETETHQLIKTLRVDVQSCCLALRRVDFQNVLERVDSAVTEKRSPTREQLEVLSTVKEITGSLVVKINETEITDLSFLRNLRVIHGRQLE